MRGVLLLLAWMALGVGALLPSTSQAQERVIKQGNFAGESGHVTRGNVRIVEDHGKKFVVLADNFFHDGAPDPKVAFGKNGFAKGSIIGKLQKLRGEQRYEVPASLDISKFNQVYIWCEQFSVPLGVAALR